jgi:cytochrome c551
MSKKHYLMTIIAAGTLLLMTACGGGNSGGNTANGGSNTGNKVVVTDIPEAYNKTCVGCHAADLSGNVGAKSNLQKVGSRLNRDQIEDIIRNGKQGTNMPAMGNRLSDEEITELADWLATLK